MSTPAALRTSWKWAAVSQFLRTFQDALGSTPWHIRPLERDLHLGHGVLPALVATLLVALTSNRHISPDNAFDHLRTQYLKRVPAGADPDPATHPLGTPTHPIQWSALSTSTQIDILHQLCEWQLADPARFRGLLKHEDDPSTWASRLSWRVARADALRQRIDPVGWDKAGNTYWLFDDHRLWVQRPLPRKSATTSARRFKGKTPVKSAVKSAVTPTVKSTVKSTVTPTPAPAPPPAPESQPRVRSQVSFYGNPTPTALALKRGDPTPLPKRGTRSSGRLSGAAPAPAPAPAPTPTHPKEHTGRTTRASQRADWAKDQDDESDLSELTDEEEHAALVRASARPDTESPSEETAETQSDDESDTPDQDPTDDIVKAAVREAENLPEGFIEWEIVCLTLHDWQTFPEQFAKSRNPDEKALYRLLTRDVGPDIIEELTAIENERLKEAAFMNRKRSSRIVAKELERDELLAREAAEREMLQRMDRTRREELRQRQEAADASAREKAREERLREREERGRAREEAVVRRLEEEGRAKERLERKRERRKRRREGEVVSEDSDGTGGSMVSTPGAGAGDKRISAGWELSCEVCLHHGWNIDGDRDMVSCDECGKWQHTACHDRLDRSRGKDRRDWSKVDFKCRDCLDRSRKRARIDTLGIHPPAPAPGHVPGHPTGTQSPGSPYPMIQGSAPGPITIHNPSRPPPPLLQPGQYYLPYPPASEPKSPAVGYAVYYPPHAPPRQQLQQVPPGDAPFRGQVQPAARPRLSHPGTAPHPEPELHAQTQGSAPNIGHPAPGVAASGTGQNGHLPGNADAYPSER